jgi:SAM-dependent methyltransferase
MGGAGGRGERTVIRAIDKCRSCGAEGLEQVLDLGRVPLANALLEESELDKPEPTFPLTLAFCPACALVQIRETVDPEVLFRRYLYFSSFSETMLEHARHASEMMIERFGLGPDSLVVEIASNDGYLLRNFVARGVPALGIEPAENIAREAEDAGVPTLCEFFGNELAQRLKGEGRAADVVIGNNVLAHVADTNGFAAGVAALLKPSGCAVFEFPYVGDMIANTEFDTIYHEHLCYFSLRAVRALFARHGLRLVDVERLPIHGGSLRVFLQPEAAAPGPSAAVAALADEETERGMTGADFYRAFAAKVENLKSGLVAELRRRKDAGQAIAAYGASAKGSTLLGYCGIGAETLDFICDRSTVKQGRFAPGNHLPILAPEALLERRPDAVLLLTWNFADEILRQQEEYLGLGGEFIVPVPEVRTVGKEALA